MMTRIQRLKADIDAVDVFFGLLPEAAGYAAFVSWASLIVRAIKGEEVEEDWRVFVSTGALMAAFTLGRERASVRPLPCEAQPSRCANLYGTPQRRRSAEISSRMIEIVRIQSDKLAYTDSRSG